MSNYVKATDFSAKDSLLTGDPLKIVSGTEIDDEFNAIQTAVNTKSNINSPSFTGTPAAPTAIAGTSTTQISTTAFVTTALDNYQTVVDAALQALYPVGSVYTNATVSTNPATLLGFGTWVSFASGRVLVGVDSGNTLFDTAEETGGTADATLVSHTHTATVSDPGHFHSAGYTDGSFGDAGSGVPLSNFSSTGSTTFNTTSKTTGITVSNSTSGVSATNKNYQPYITVYMWKRVS